MGSDQHFVVIGNKDGPEGQYSKESANEAAAVLRARIVMLESSRWKDQLRLESESKIFFLATHGSYGEDGTLQSYLESRAMRHTHSPASAARIMSNKHKAKCWYRGLNIPTPGWRWCGNAFGDVADVGVWLTKPVDGGGKFGLNLSTQLESDPALISEAYIVGNLEISIWLLGSEDLIVLPPLLRERSVERLGHLVDMEKEPPARLADTCVELARRFHRSIGAHGLTKTDFVIDEQGLPWAVETDAHPALGRNHGAARQADKANLDYERLIVEIAKDYV